jgi:hypothetical protein
MSVRPRSDSAPEGRAPPNDSYAGLDDDAMIVALRADCQRAAITYVNNVVTDRPDSVASCTFYRAGTLVVTRPESVQALPCHIDATAGLSAEEVVVSRRAAADRSGAEHYDLVHVVRQPSVRVLFVHVASASDALVRAAAVGVVNEDAGKNVAAPKNVVVDAAAADPPAPATGEFEVVVLNEKGDDAAVPERPMRKKRVTGTQDAVRMSERCSDGSDGCERDDLEAGGANGEVQFDALESTTAGLARRCVIL